MLFASVVVVIPVVAFVAFILFFFLHRALSSPNLSIIVHVCFAHLSAQKKLLLPFLLSVCVCVCSRPTSMDL